MKLFDSFLKLLQIYYYFCNIKSNFSFQIIGMKAPKSFLNLFTFYRDGFRSMTVGKTLWLIVIIKLFIMFVVLKIFFFPNYLNTNFDNDKSKAEHVRQELVKEQ